MNAQPVPGSVPGLPNGQQSPVSVQQQFSLSTGPMDDRTVAQVQEAASRTAPMDKLIDALTLQTAAINRLAESNEALVRAMAEDVGMDDDGEPAPRRYMDGSPM